MRRFTLFVSLAVLLAACGGTAEPGNTTSATETTSSATETTSTANTATTAVATPSTSELAPSSIRDLGIGSINLQPAGEGGPHPTLSWEPIAGSETYWLFLRDGSGQIYWAWSGTDTSVRVGGGTRRDLNQTAALHEEMTWSVMAFDSSNALMAVSEIGDVSP